MGAPRGYGAPETGGLTMDYAKESLRLHEQWGGKIEVNARVPV